MSNCRFLKNKRAAAWAARLLRVSLSSTWSFFPENLVAFFDYCNPMPNDFPSTAAFF
jgi:hypothetical protein